MKHFMRPIAFSVAVLSWLGVGEGSARADLIGTSVTGSLTFEPTFGSTNYYDPANGFVPAGFENSAGTTVTISSTAVEFGFRASAEVDSDFTGSRLTVSNVELATATYAPYQFSFTDAAFAFRSLTKVSDTWDNGGVTGSLSGTTLSITWAGGQATIGNSMAAVFSFSPTPEPSGVVLASLGALLLAGMRWRRGRCAGPWSNDER
jgi:hypothetical protein